jgi:hypothetical protein
MISLGWQNVRIHLHQTSDQKDMRHDGPQFKIVLSSPKKKTYHKFGGALNHNFANAD